MDPLVTVVIPTYNRAILVQQAIASVVSQTYLNWELIVVDDGSDDGTCDAIVSMNDSRIKLLTMQHTGNIAMLRNNGVKNGSGEWLAFLDSDDVWTPQRLEIQLSLLVQKGKRWGYGGFELMDKNMDPIPARADKHPPVSGWIIKEVLATAAPVYIGGLMVERKLFEEAGGFNEDPTLLFREDYELIIRLAMRSEALAIPDLMVRIREHEGRATNEFDAGHDRMAAVYEHFLRSRPDHALAKIAHRRMAHELAESAGKCIAGKKYAEAIRRLSKASIHGDSLRHTLSAVRRGFAASLPAHKRPRSTEI